jgi:hypothetical protein
LDVGILTYPTGSSANSQEARSDDNEEDQWSLWGRLVADWANTYKKRNAYVKDLVRKGIPHHFRGVVWPLLCGANDSPAKSQYAEYIKATSACEKVSILFSSFFLSSSLQSGDGSVDGMIII